MKNGLLICLFFCLCHSASAQNDFTTAKARRIIAQKHIRQITGYLVQKTDSILIDSLVFNKRGLCVSEFKDGKLHTYRYNKKDMLLHEAVTGNEPVTYTYRHDAKGHVLLAERIRSKGDSTMSFADYNKHRFKYNKAGKVLGEYWFTGSGDVHQQYRYTYYNEGDVQVVNAYDSDNKLTYVKKYFKNGHIKDYSVDNGVVTFAAESIQDKKGNLLKFTDYSHVTEASINKLQQTGQGRLDKDTLTEVYTYTPYGFCKQQLNYSHKKLTGKINWYFKK